MLGIGASLVRLPFSIDSCAQADSRLWSEEAVTGETRKAGRVI